MRLLCLPENSSLAYKKLVMTGPKGNSEFCFTETSMFPKAKPRGTLKVEGK